MSDLQPGSIWRENDPRFVRHVKVISVGGGTLPRVAITTVDADDGREVSKRVTYAAMKAFGKRYKFVRADTPHPPA